uniref:Uncharacterized protein n=1 Tax=Lepeophtheirus salmonis TaxID=72036 RepID=A0A0K2UKS3_LEPSM
MSSQQYSRLKESILLHADYTLREEASVTGMARTTIYNAKKRIDQYMNIERKVGFGKKHIINANAL